MRRLFSRRYIQMERTSSLTGIFENPDVHIIPYCSTRWTGFRRVTEANLELSNRLSLVVFVPWVRTKCARSRIEWAQFERVRDSTSARLPRTSEKSARFNAGDICQDTNIMGALSFDKPVTQQLKRASRHPDAPRHMNSVMLQEPISTGIICLAMLDAQRVSLRAKVELLTPHNGQCKGGVFARS
ncbi:hypothetical protein K474DRAFT_1094500 [Panus rudis PR-1116 ss-1]|nr:hypothetical protein K474DRAFT_1094500 [Panus rudis PR-1116 ss-1]